MGFVEALQRGGMLFLFVFLVLAVLYGLILLFSAILRLVQGKKKEEPAAKAEVVTAAPAAAALVPTGVWGGQLRLQDVDEQTAAIIMAIVSDESGIPLSELVFKSIRLVSPGQE
jgi:Na+-transporting methylmalonyl-CoA/oxaloacetate decarboxylase gamma subunit